MSNNFLILGIEGGGTKTYCVIADCKGRILSVGKAGPSNLSHVDTYTFKNNLLLAYERAINKIDLTNKDSIKLVICCLAGVGGKLRWKKTFKLIEKLNLAKNIILESDVMASFMSTLMGKRGVIVVAGTGSIVFGIDDENKRVRVGGWGYLINDEGSAFFIGREAIRHALRALEGREKTKLLHEVPSYFKVKTIEEVVDLIAIGKIKVNDIASLAPLVEKLAMEGDEVSYKIIDMATNELLDMVKCALSKMKLKELNIGLSGSVLLKSKLIRKIFIRKIKREWNNAIIREPVLPTFVGPILLGYKLLGINMNRIIMNNLYQSLSKIEY